MSWPGAPLPRPPTLFLLPIVVFIISLTVFPLFFSVYLSFQNYNLITPASARFTGLDNFKDLSGLVTSLVVILEFVAMAVPLEIILGLGIAVLLAEQSRISRMMTALIVIPVAIPGIAGGLMWRYMFQADIGIVNSVLSALGIITSPISWLGAPQTALPSLVVIDAWNWTPFTALIMLAGLYSLPREPFEAADLDGASAVSKFRYLTLPMLRPILLVAFIFRLFDALNFFQVPFITTAGGPGTTTQTVPIYLYIVGFQGLTIGRAAALSYIMLVITMILSYPAVRWLQKPK
jgi:multiple sugar transport system permease protein